ncbi:MAG: ribosome small subunit-dependent GTPase A [Pseudomonadota bacterium]
MTAEYSLQQLGWRPHFQAQLVDASEGEPARVAEVQRSRVMLLGETGALEIELGKSAAAMHLTVGDWVVVNTELGVVRQKLEPFSLFKRRAAGTSADLQFIAANVDTLFIVTSANRDFNVARLERYLAIAHEANAFPVIVITKADLVDDVGEFARAAAQLSPGLLVESLDAREPEQVAVLRPWCEAGQTVALLGSSGVGKSTIVNTLTGAAQETYDVREDDQRGRHTTTSRSMHKLAEGGWLIDTPGMRELQLVDVGDALDDVFADVAELATSCRFADCGHESEPGCAVLSAIERGELDADRLRRYRKLQSEDRHNSATLAERRSHDKSLSKMYKSVQSGQRKLKGDDS